MSEVEVQDNPIRLDETSTLNLFWIKNGRILISTASKDMYAPMILTHMNFSTTRPTPKYTVDLCKHEYIFIERKQLRRADEGESEIFQCKLCNATKINN